MTARGHELPVLASRRTLSFSSRAAMSDAGQATGRSGSATVGAALSDNDVRSVEAAVPAAPA